MNILFLLLFFLIFLLTYRKCQNYYVRILTALPFFLNLIIYFGNTMGQSFTYVNGNKRAMIWSSSNLNNPLYRVRNETVTFLSRYLDSYFSSLGIITMFNCWNLFKF